MAGLLARKVGCNIMPGEIEETFICALFYELGQILAQFYFPEEVQAARNLMQAKNLSEKHAAAQVLGLSFEELGIGIAKTWGFPSAILHSMHHLPEQTLKKPVSHVEMLRLVAGYSNEVCRAIAVCTSENRGKVLRTLVERFAVCLPISEKLLLAAVEESFGELKEFATVLQANLKHSQFVRQVRIFLGSDLDARAASPQAVLERTLADTALDLPPSFTEETNISTAQGVLASGIQDISNSLVEDFTLNDILRITIETMYRAMGFRRVLLCLKDGRSDMMVGRFGFGADVAELAKVFRFPLAFEPNVFHLSLQKAVDLIISDIDDPKIAERIPQWFRDQVGAKTFVLFPLTLRNNPVALIYCDKETAGSIVIPANELTLLKTLRNQALLAIKQYC
jgi:hypothetical protein